MKRFLHLFFAVALVICFVSSNVVASWEDDLIDSGTCGDGLFWYLDVTGTITIKGQGKMDNFSAGGQAINSPWNRYTKKITNVIIEDGVSSIGNYAFCFCSGVSSVTISESVTSIGNSAFFSCDLQQLTIPNSVTSIGELAFAVCTNLSDVSISENVRKIGGSAFQACKNLTSIVIPNGISTISEFLFTGCSALKNVSLPNTITSIEQSAFSLCSSLENISIPENVRSIGASAFAGCSSLENIILPNSISSIGASAFSGSKVKTIAIPDGVTVIDESTFYQCSKLKSISLPKSLREIKNYAFYGCDALSDIYYAGDKARWSWVELYNNTNSLSKATMHYESSFENMKMKTAFEDVPEDAYYEDAVSWAVTNKITNGTSTNTFSPNNNVTRGQAVTFLWRAMGMPSPKSIVNSFTDVKSSDYFYKAVLWAVEQGITKGTGSSTFSPEGNVTRGQMVTFLYRTMGEPEKTGSGAWYTDAENWANHQNLLIGTAISYATNGDCPRSDVVFYLWKVLA